MFPDAKKLFARPSPECCTCCRRRVSPRPRFAPAGIRARAGLPPLSRNHEHSSGSQTSRYKNVAPSGGTDGVWPRLRSSATNGAGYARVKSSRRRERCAVSPRCLPDTSKIIKADIKRWRHSHRILPQSISARQQVPQIRRIAPLFQMLCPTSGTRRAMHLATAPERSLQRRSTLYIVLRYFILTVHSSTR